MIKESRKGSFGENFFWCDVREQAVPNGACSPSRCRSTDSAKCKHYEQAREERKMAQEQNPTVQHKSEDGTINVIVQATSRGAYAVAHFREPRALKTSGKVKLPKTFSQEGLDLIEKIRKDMLKLVSLYGPLAEPVKEAEKPEKAEPKAKAAPKKETAPKAEEPVRPRKRVAPVKEQDNGAKGLKAEDINI